MFSLYGDWNLVAVMDVSRGGSRVFIVGCDGLPGEPNRYNPKFYLEHGYTIIEVKKDEVKQKLIDAGLDSKTPLIVSGFVASPITKSKDGEKKTITFSFTDLNSFVQAEGGFENQYCMCDSCYHPVSTTVKVELMQSDLDKLNQGEIVNFDSGELYYQCQTCGNRVQKTYKNLKIWRTLTGPELDAGSPSKKKSSIRGVAFKAPMPEDFSVRAEAIEFLDPREVHFAEGRPADDRPLPRDERERRVDWGQGHMEELLRAADGVAAPVAEEEEDREIGDWFDDVDAGNN